MSTKEQRDEWRAKRHCGMTSAVGEYTPSEFWELLDEVERLERDLHAARDIEPWKPREGELYLQNVPAALVALMCEGVRRAVVNGNLDARSMAADAGLLLEKHLKDAVKCPVSATREATHPNGLWMVYYEDADVKPEIFFGEGAEAAARARYEQANVSWSCHLLSRVPTGSPSTTGHKP